MIEFVGWPKTPRLFRDIVITEKIDGTNAAVVIDEGHPADSQFGYCAGAWVDETFYKVGAQSRKRIITLGDDNFGFAAWVNDHADSLARILGPGRHFGEWWGSGIQRGYGLQKGEKRFSLFNVNRYADKVQVDGVHQLVGLDVVPVLYEGPFSEDAIRDTAEFLRSRGSFAPYPIEFDNPEGIIVFHSASGQVFKVLLENDDLPKTLVAAA